MPQASHFQRAWIAATAGGLSNWMVQVALFYAVLRLHGATELAWVVLAGNLPALLLGPFMGAAVDRWDAGTVALLAGIVQAVSLFAVGGLLSGSLAALALTYACYNASNSLGRTARQRLLYEVIPPPARARANASIGSASGIVTIVGAALGGGAALFGPLPILVAAVSVRLAGTASLYGVRPTRSAVQVPGAKEPYWYTLADGFRSVHAFPRATSVLLVGVAWGLIGGGYDVLLSDYGVHVFHGGGGGLSALYVADGIGVVLGTLAARKVGTGLKGHVYGWAYMFQGAFWILFALRGFSETPGTGGEWPLWALFKARSRARKRHWGCGKATVMGERVRRGHEGPSLVPAKLFAGGGWWRGETVKRLSRRPGGRSR